MCGCSVCGTTCCRGNADCLWFADSQWERGGQSGVFLPTQGHLRHTHRPGRQTCKWVTDRYPACKTQHQENKKTGFQTFLSGQHASVIFHCRGIVPRSNLRRFPWTLKYNLLFGWIGRLVCTAGVIPNWIEFLLPSWEKQSRRQHPPPPPAGLSADSIRSVGCINRKTPVCASMHMCSKAWVWGVLLNVVFFSRAWS